MSTQIPDETLKQWREEFEKLEGKQLHKYARDSWGKIIKSTHTDGEYDHTHTLAQWLGFLAAKTSSYDREQFLVQQRDLISDAANRVGETNQKLQERIAQLEESKGVDINVLDSLDRENGEFQKEIKKLKKEISQLNVSLLAHRKSTEYSEDLEFKLTNQVEQIAKRDQLISQAVELLKFSAGMVGRDEWLKQADELKGKK